MKNVIESLIIPEGFSPDASVIQKLRAFLKTFEPFEERTGVKLLLLKDKRSEAFYLNCHLDSEILASKTDVEAVLDPTESENYKLNREIYTDTYAYRLGSIPKVVEKGIGISYPIVKPINKKGRIYRWRKDTTRDRN